MTITNTMMIIRIFAFIAALVLVESEVSDYPEVDRCTTIIVGELAGSEGPMTTHTGKQLLFILFIIRNYSSIILYFRIYDYNYFSISGLLGL